MPLKKLPFRPSVAARRAAQCCGLAVRAWSPAFLLGGMLLSACSDGDKAEQATVAKPLTEAQKIEKINKRRLDFTAPVLIDSSVYVMYPLVLGSSSREESDSYGSKYSASRTYWNIIFYNTATGNSHLLTDKKMVVYSYSEQETSPKTSSFSSTDVERYDRTKISQVDKLLYYSVRTTDFNQDGDITEQDPVYLFVSDKAGRGFRQVSPDGYNVESSEAIKGANKILLQVTRDSDGNKIFNEKDLTFPMVYDLNKEGLPQELFSEQFKGATKKLLDSQWPVKP